MFGITGSKSFACSLQSALISAAREDNFHPRKKQHDSGWGGVWYTTNFQNYYRTKTPIFTDSFALKFLEMIPEENLIGLSHARLTSDINFKRGPFDSHPFTIHINDELLYVSHNGEIDKSKLLKYGIDNERILNDSEFFTFLLERCQGNSVKERLEEAVRAVQDNDAMRSALDLIVLSVKRTGEQKIYYFCDYRNSNMELYYSLYTLKSDQASAVMSSTIAYKLGFLGINGDIQDNKVSKCEARKVLLL